MLRFDETGEPFLDSRATADEWQIHDRWFDHSCEHKGYFLKMRLGNIALVAGVREKLGALDHQPSRTFPILLAQVVQNGTHSGDHIAAHKSPALLVEAEALLSEDSLDELQRHFMEQVKQPCVASIETGYPIVF
jgi:hypothetical protein